MLEAAGRIFPDTEAAHPLVKQLIFEQCTKECRAAIAPHKNKSLETWTKLCREIGGPLTNSGLAAMLAAVFDSSTRGRGPGKQGSKRTASIQCFKCGQIGHVKRQCPSWGEQEAASDSRQDPPGLCPRCLKGQHRAEECCSLYDAAGRLLAGRPIPGPKNGLRGSPRQGDPQSHLGKKEGRGINNPFYPTASQSEQHQDQQGWTSVPPPDSY